MFFLLDASPLIDLISISMDSYRNVLTPGYSMPWCPRRDDRNETHNQADAILTSLRDGRYAEGQKAPGFYKPDFGHTQSPTHT